MVWSWLLVCEAHYIYTKGHAGSNRGIDSHLWENEHDLNIWRMLLVKSKVEGNSIHCLVMGLCHCWIFLLISLHLRNQANAKKWGGKKSAPQGWIIWGFFLKHNQRFFANTFHYVEAKHTTPFLIAWKYPSEFNSSFLHLSKCRQE